MWFKNIHLFRLTEKFTLSAEALHDKLCGNQSRACGKLEKQTFGWTPPLGKDYELLVQATAGCYLLAARKEERLLPSSVVKDHVAEKVAKIEKEEGRKVSTRERRDLFDELSVTLLPQAFCKSHTTYLYIDTKNDWLIVDTSSANRAEEVTVLLRNSLGSLKLAGAEVKQDPAFIMTDWLKLREMPTGFCIEDHCELISPDTKSTIIRCVNQDLFAKEIVGHLNSGKQVCQLAMSWKDRVSFVISKDLMIKRIKFLDLIQDEVKDVSAETYEQQFETDFAIFSSEFGEMLPELYALFGGLNSLTETSELQIESV